MFIKDITTGKSAMRSAIVTGVGRTFGSVLVVEPSNPSTWTLYPLADFGQVRFGKHYTSVKGTCFINYSPMLQANATRIVMRDSASSPVKASAYATSISSFTVSWRRAGPKGVPPHRIHI